MAFIRQRGLLLAALWSAGWLSATPGHAQTTVLAPDIPIAGTDQASLSQQWWNWAASYAPAGNPIRDLTGALSSLGDQGAVFFLAGANTSDPVVRSVTVRNDQTLFFPLVNVVDGYTDSQIADLGLTDSAIRTETINVFGNASGLFLTLNGNNLALPASTPNLFAFRQPTGRFDMIIPSDDNIFGGPPGAPAGILRSFSDGYWVGLSPIANGSYRLHFGGHTESTGPFAGLSNTQDISYQITVVPEPATVLLMLLGLAALGGKAARQRAA